MVRAISVEPSATGPQSSRSIEIGDQALGQMLQDCRCGYPVAGVLADVTPYDAPARFDDEHSRCSETIAQQVVHAIGLGDVVPGIGQHGIAHPCALAPSFDDFDRCNYQRDHLCSGILERLIVTLQLTELRIGTSAATALEKDQHHRALGQLLRQREAATSGPLERKVGGDFGDREHRGGRWDR
jgi:hypothetical protein